MFKPVGLPNRWAGDRARGTRPFFSVNQTVILYKSGHRHRLRCSPGVLVHHVYHVSYNSAGVARGSHHSPIQGHHPFHD
jgi:hypothetical protein